MIKTLYEIHQDVPADHYDKGIKRNLFQKFWHRKRFREVLRLVPEVDGPILDVGCHAGLFTEQIAQKTGNKSIYGVDISSDAIKLAKKRIPYGNFQVADAHKLPYKDNFFSAVYCLEVLEHVDDPLCVLKEIKRVLKKGGYGFLLVPTDNGLFKVIWFLWTTYYPVWKHAHVQSFHSNVLEDLLGKLGLKILHVKELNLGMLKIVVFKKV